MRYLLSKSIQLIIVIVVIGFLTTLCLSNLVEAYKMVGIPANGLTNNYFSFAIGEHRDKISMGKIKLLDMLTFLNNQKSEIVLLKEADNRIFGVYAVNRIFEPKMISGRTFSEDDFKNNTNTILISEELKDKCLDKDGKKFYLNDVNYFEVIGIFKKGINLINTDALAYYNLSSDRLVSKNMIYDNYIFGRYQIDAGHKTAEIVNSLNDYYIVKTTRTTSDNSFSEKLQKTISAQSLTLFPIILIIFMVLLNSINMSSNWIENRRKEIFVRRLVGATNRKISVMLVKDYLTITTLSYILVLLMAVLLFKIDLIIFLNFKFSLVTVVISYLTVLLISLISAGLMLITFYRTSISQIRG